MLVGGPGVAAAEVAHDLGHAPELLWIQVAARHLDLGGGKSVLALGPDIRGQPRGEGLLVAVGTAGIGWFGGCPRLFLVHKQQRAGVKVPLGDPLALHFFVN